MSLSWDAEPTPVYRTVRLDHGYGYLGISILCGIGNGVGVVKGKCLHLVDQQLRNELNTTERMNSFSSRLALFLMAIIGDTSGAAPGGHTCTHTSRKDAGETQKVTTRKPLITPLNSPTIFSRVLPPPARLGWHLNGRQRAYQFNT